MTEYLFAVTEETTGMRLDLFLSKSLTAEDKGFSRTWLQKMIAGGLVTLNGQTLKPNYKVRALDQIKVVVEEQKPLSLEPEDIPLEIVYQDQDLAIINKPSGLVSHPAPGNYSHTLVNALLWHIKQLSDISPGRPGIVHRLDKDTSGLIVVAKNNAAHLFLSRQFAEHSIKRKYVALVKGLTKFDEGLIEVPIGRDPLRREKMAVAFTPDTRYAKTRYRTLKRRGSFSLLELEPFTGRTHQLRVHLAFLGHPILGDRKYSMKDDAKRLMLHARYIGFMHPSTSKFVEFESKLPQEFAIYQAEHC